MMPTAGRHQLAAITLALFMAAGCDGYEQPEAAVSNVTESTSNHSFVLMRGLYGPWTLALVDDKGTDDPRDDELLAREAHAPKDGEIAERYIAHARSAAENLNAWQTIEVHGVTSWTSRLALWGTGGSLYRGDFASQTDAEEHNHRLRELLIDADVPMPLNDVSDVCGFSLFVGEWLYGFRLGLFPEDPEEGALMASPHRATVGTIDERVHQVLARAPVDAAWVVQDDVSFALVDEHGDVLLQGPWLGDLEEIAEEMQVAKDRLAAKAGCIDATP